MIYILPIEPIDMRYTAQWYKCIPEQLRNLGEEVTQIDGEVLEEDTTPGAFLNFCSTNVWKNTQINNLAKLINDGKIKSGDKILITDAWNTGILQIKYMKELLNLDIEIHGIWHAGSYDPTDFLGRMNDTKWSKSAERAIAESLDYNYFATKFHRDMFVDVVLKNDPTVRCEVVGQPHELLVEQVKKYANSPKKNEIIFPHRIAPEKQVEIFKDLEQSLPEYNFVVTQEMNLTKDEYYKKLAESKICFSCSLHEMLGISCLESMLLGTIPLMPKRRAYAEIYDEQFLYPSEWTESFEAYLEHKDELIKVIRYIMENYKEYDSSMKQFNETGINDYISGSKMYSFLRG